MELISGRFTFHIFLFFRRDYPGEKDVFAGYGITLGSPDSAKIKREHDVCDRVRLDWSVTVMADRQDVLRSELNKIILEIS